MTTPELNLDDSRLTAFALGELDDAGRAEFEQMLAASPDLQQVMTEIQDLTVSLRAELQAEPAGTFTEEDRLKLHQQAQETEHVVMLEEVSPPHRWYRRTMVIGAEVLAVSVAVVLVFFVARQNETSNAKHYSEATQSARITEVFDSSESMIKALPSADYSEEVAMNGDQEGLSNELFFRAPLGVASQSNQPGPDLNYPLEAASIKVAPPVVADPVRNLPGLSDIRGPTVSDQRPGLIAPANPVDSKPVSSERWGVEKSNGDRVWGRANRPADFETEEIRSPNSESYSSVAENKFLTPSQQPLSTFSIDVDSASYTNVRRFLTQGQLPPADAVRIEEMVNFFSYDYPQPKGDDPFSVTADAARCPWQREHYLARIALKTRTIDKAKRPPTNLVFLLDVSGSMQAANKLPLVKQAMTLLAEELNERDRIAIVTYAGDAGVKLASTSGADQTRVMQAIESLQAGGSTNGAAGINVAYEQALQNFNGEGENRVILCTDGDFNVGVSSDDQLVQLIQQHAKSKVFLSIFGFGMGNLKDAKLEKLADKGNGHYGYIDDLKEARRVFNEELVGTLYTVAKDVKIQVEFNPLTVGAYRLIGYENRALAAKDFNDDTKDAGEIGAGHTVTALYEIIPSGQWAKAQEVDPLKYSGNPAEPRPVVVPPKTGIPADVADDLFTVKLRYKPPMADASIKTVDLVVDDIAEKNIVPSADFRWAAAVASFGMHLKRSKFVGRYSLDDVYEASQGAKGEDANGRRREFLDLIQAARRIKPPAAGPDDLR